MPEHDLVTAIGTPFALATVFLFLLTIAAFIWTTVSSSTAAVKLRKPMIMAILFSLVVSGMVTYRAARQIGTDREYRSLHAFYNVRATVSGTIRTTTFSEPLTFRASSGQVNVGCNDSRGTNVNWNVPADATDVQYQARWEGTDNLKTQTQDVIRNGQTITATGSVVGLDKNFFGNCQGGGHGELVLTGTYRLPRSEAHGQQVFKTLDDKINRQQSLFIAVPHSDEKIPEVCDITVDEGSRHAAAKLELQVNETGVLSIRRQSIDNGTPNPIPLNISLDGDRIVLRIP